MKKGDLVELTIEKYAYEGKGIAKVNKELIKPSAEKDEGLMNEVRYVVFVTGSYPGDTVKAELRKIKKSYSEAKAVEIITPSEFRTEARCKYFGTCGGCKQQDLDYEMQLKYKQEQVEEIFRMMGGFSEYEKENIISSENKFFYRNKMEFSFGDKRWLTKEEINKGGVIDRDFALGLHIPGMFDKILDIDECFLQSELSSRILNATRSFFKRKKDSRLFYKDT